MRALAEHLRDGAGGLGRMVVVDGPAGIGKSALLRVAVAAASRQGTSVLTARGSEFEHDVPFGVARQLCEPLLSRVSDEERERLLSGPAAPAEGIVTGHDPVGALSSPDAGHRMLHALYWLIVGVSDRQPLLLVIDDLQWADRATLSLLTYVERRIEALPVLIVGAVRSGELAADAVELRSLLVGQRTPPLRPRPLSLDATGVVLAARLRGDPAPEFTAACHRATGGNPYFLRELVEALRIGRIAPSAEMVEFVLDFGPPAVARSVMHRLASLPSECTAAAHACAVLGAAATRHLVGAVSGLDPTTLDRALRRLAAADLISDDERPEFAHPLVRAAIHAEIATDDRGALSCAAARELAAAGQSDQAAAHLLDVAPAGERWIVDTLLDAASLATARGAPQTAVTLLQRALAEPPAPDRQVDVLTRLGSVQAQTGSSDALVTLRRALDGAGDDDDRTRVTLALATAYVTYGRGSEAARTLARTAATLHDQDGGLRRVLDLEQVALVGMATQQAPPADVLDRVAELSRDDPHAARILSSYRAFVSVARGHPAPVALRDVERALAVGEEHGPPAWSPRLRTVMMLGFCGEPDRARGYFDDAVASAQRRGAPFELSVALGLRGAMSYLMGEMLAVEADARASLDLIPENGPVPPTYLSLLIDVMLERDCIEEAQRAWRRLEGLDTLAPGLTRSVITAARGRLRIVAGETRAGLDDLLAAGAQQDAAGCRNPALLPWLSGAALAHLQLGQRVEAITLSRENLDRAERFGVAFVLGRALRVHGTVLGPQDGLGHLREAVEMLTPSYARMELAYARVALGTALHHGQQTRPARHQLQAAAELGHQLGATRIARLASDALVDAGGRPRRQLAGGQSALTPAERRVADAVAAGLSNRVAAQTLFLTEKTVETHLRNAYRKLDISSRVQLPSALAGQITTATVRAGAPI